MTQATPSNPKTFSPDMPREMLGGLSPAQFMRGYWQKKPLLIRNAFPDFKPFLNRQALFAMAAEEAVESRMIVSKPAGWQLKHGPRSEEHTSELQSQSNLV